MIECHISGSVAGGTEIPPPDNISGLLKSIDIQHDCFTLRDTLNMLWGADNDGDPIEGEFVRILKPSAGGPTKSTPDVTGCFFLTNSNDFFHKLNYSFNWVANTGIPYQSLINLYLRDCAQENRDLKLLWK